MTGARRGPAGTAARVGLAVLLLGVLAVVVLRPGDPDETDPPADATPAPSGIMPTATPSAPPSEEAFCIDYRTMAGAQSQYVASPDETGVELLREAADRLLATGIPESMPITARGGFFTELSGIYGSIGLTLDPQAVPGAVDGDTQVPDASAAFGTYLSTHCPAYG